MIYDHERITVIRAFQLWREGVDLACPICGTVLSIIPEALPRNETPLGMLCSKNKQHVYFYAESRATLESVKNIIRGMPKKDNPGI